jgi:hypothetical protein
MTYEQKFLQDACEAAKQNRGQEHKIQTFWFYAQLFGIGAVYALIFIIIDLKF